MNTIIENRILDIKRYIENYRKEIEELELRLRLLKKRNKTLEKELRAYLD